MFFPHAYDHTQPQTLNIQSLRHQAAPSFLPIIIFRQSFYTAKVIIIFEKTML